MFGMACAYCDLCVLHGQSRVLSGHRRDFLFTFSLASRSTSMRDTILTCATQKTVARDEGADVWENWTKAIKPIPIYVENAEVLHETYVVSDIWCNPD